MLMSNPDLKKLREKKGFSQEGLGYHLGVSGRQVRRYENGETMLSRGQIVPYARALDVPAEEILLAAAEIEAIDAREVDSWDQ